MFAISNLSRYTPLLMCLAVVGCVTASVTPLNLRMHAPVAPLDVELFLPGDTPPEDCERVALISAKGGMGANEGKVYKKFRQEAGKRGANALHISKVEESGTFKQIMLGTTQEGDAIALWCPSLSS